MARALDARCPPQEGSIYPQVGRIYLAAGKFREPSVPYGCTPVRCQGDGRDGFHETGAGCVRSSQSRTSSSLSLGRRTGPT
jgi:hypothetical protein